MDGHCKSHSDQQRAEFLRQVKILFNIEDVIGLELFAQVNRISQLSEILENYPVKGTDVSGARWRILMILMVEEQMGNHEGVTPTALSSSRRVSKNTISALLRGLEDQGLIQRTLNPKDLRGFRIQLTQVGRDLVLETGSRRMKGLNKLLEGLDEQERQQLKVLLDKLYHLLILKIQQISPMCEDKNDLPLENI